MKNLTYSPAGPTIKSFHESDAFVRCVIGPLGSGKSSACCVEILRRAMKQAPSLIDGKRRSKWVVIRNSYPELKSTTLRTWMDWCPAEYGKVNHGSPISHKIVTADLDLEVLFMALDRPEDAKKLLSLEVTGAWINECREIQKPILDALTGRVGRYPSKREGGATWSGIIMDSNPPDTESWLYQVAENDKPEGWQFWRQPGGDGVAAENIENLPKNYYQRLKSGKSEDWINVYVKGEYGFVTEGKAVFPMWRDSVHCAPEELEPVQRLPLLIGCDFGLTPAAVIGQKMPDGRWLILDEYVEDGCGVIRFAENLQSYVNRIYPGFVVDGCWGDPSGSARSTSDERTSLEIMNTHTEWKWYEAPTNDLTMRREVVVHALNRLVDGRPGFQLSPKCAVLRKGFSGGYHYKLFADGTQTMERPNKNSYSHPHDALQYLLLGGGEHSVVMQDPLRRKRKFRTRIANGIDYKVFG